MNEHHIFNLSFFFVSIQTLYYSWERLLYLAGCTSIYDGFDKDAQICMVFLGAVAFNAHTQTCRTRVTEGDLKGQELSGPIRGQDQLVLLCLL